MIIIDRCLFLAAHMWKEQLTLSSTCPNLNNC